MCNGNVWRQNQHQRASTLPLHKRQWEAQVPAGAQSTAGGGSIESKKPVVLLEVSICIMLDMPTPLRGNSMAHA